MRATARLAGLVQAALLAGGCATTTTIIPPPTPAAPVPVLVLDHGRHASLVLPHPRGSVRYAYGDRDWYARVEVGVSEASSAVMGASPAVLGRRVLEVPPATDRVLGALRVGVEDLHRVIVDKAEATALRRDLDALFMTDATRIDNTTYDLTFVAHPEPYSAGHNSNHKVAEWLERMGCRVEGTAFWSNWRVAEEGPSRRGRAE